MTRAALATAGAALLGLVLVGAAAAGPRDPVQRHTAADTKRAQALVLKRSDLAAGWKTDKHTPPGPSCTAGPDESDLVQTARLDPSFTWKDGVTNVGSEVDIFRSAREARQDWRSSTLRLLGTCLMQSARHGAGPSVDVTLLSEKSLPPPSGVERSLHYRFVFTLHSAQTVQLVADIVALGRGRVTSVLHTLTVKTALPSTAVNALTRVLIDRLGASAPSS